MKLNYSKVWKKVHWIIEVCLVEDEIDRDIENLISGRIKNGDSYPSYKKCYMEWVFKVLDP